MSSSPLTTDNQDEIFDVVNEADEVIGQVSRGIANSTPSLIHRSINVMVFQGNTIFLHKRSETKDTYANYWTCSCAGHVDSGEVADHAAVRELSEELGLIAEEPLTLLFKEIVHYPHETEMMSFYRYDTIEEPVLDPKEIAEGLFVPLKDIEAFLMSQPKTPCLERAMKWIRENVT